MKQIDLIFRTMAAELQQRSFDAQWSAEFPPTGRFVRVKIGDHSYWYFDQPNGEGGQKRRYVGPAANPEISARVATFKGEKNDYQNRRKVVAALTREAGLVAPDRFTGQVVEALANAGLFRFRGVLVGTVAFQCYSDLLGVRLPAAAIPTGDADLVQDYAISDDVFDLMPPIVDLLQGVDPSFRALPHGSGSSRSSVFCNSSGYRVEFLMTNRSSEEKVDQPAEMPAPGGAAADPLRFMDFLLLDPVRTILLHGAGVLVTVPAPERFAVHTLIVAGSRPDDASGRARKDRELRQAGILFDALQSSGGDRDLARVMEEAWARGPRWKAALTAGVEDVPKEHGPAVHRMFGILPR